MKKNNMKTKKKMKKSVALRHDEDLAQIQEGWHQAMKDLAVTHHWIVKRLVMVVTNKEHDLNAPSRISALDKLAKLKGEPPVKHDLQSIRSMASLSDAELAAMVQRGEEAMRGVNDGDS